MCRSAKVRLKATDKIVLRRRATLAACKIDRCDLDAWLGRPEPVVLVVYDATNERAYWLYVQAYFERIAGFKLSAIGRTVTVHLPVQNLVNPATIRKFARYNDDVVRQQLDRVKHHE